MSVLKNICYRTVVKKFNGDSVTPILIFRRLQGERKFLFESSSQYSNNSQYSYIGVNPVKTIVGSNQQIIETNYHTNKVTEHIGDMFANLKYLMPEFKSDEPYAFIGGAIGYASYHTMNGASQEECEINIPDLQFDLYDTVIIYDHLTDEVIVVHTDFERSYEDAKVEQLIQAIFTTTVNRGGSYELSAFQSVITDEHYSQLVQQAQAYILEGKVAQLVLSKRLVAQMSGDAFSLYRKLRKLTPAPYMYYSQFPDHVIIGVSPESVVKIEGSHVTITPVTGARPRGLTPREDISVELSLLQNAKEVSVHKLLVDQTIQDLEIICAQNSIQIVEYMKPVQFKHSIRLTTEIEAMLHPFLHPIDALKILFPPASSSGVPKRTASEIINKLEPIARSFYGGALGYFSLNGNVNFTLLQQTMLIKNNRAYIQAGANILSDTQEADAILETRKKIKAFTMIEETRK